MLRRIALGVLAVFGVGVAILAVGLTWAHLAIRHERPPLPPRTVVTMAPAIMPGELPVRLTFVNTASQPMPRSTVLASRQDPRPDAPYVMSYPSFVLEWADGRILLVDVGMTRAGARDFGRLVERVSGAAPIQPLAGVAERLGAARQRVRAILFTHLHIDHVGGIRELCRGLEHPVRVLMTEAQAYRPNYTTRTGLRLVHDADCVRVEVLPQRSLIPVPGFGGIFVIPAGGHTPGSQLVVAVVREQAGVHGYIVTGDIVNNIDGITYNIPKPFFYRWLMVPEDNSHLDELRRFLRDLRDGNRFRLLVSHDQRALEASGVPEWTDNSPDG
jgi:glyoxylase-like metal-dependent hydrolase (beta-lactamase superfamily II)